MLKVGAGTECCVKMPKSSKGKVYLLNQDKLAEPRSFDFDYAYWSHDEDENNNVATQQTVMADLGRLYLDNVFNGFNTSIFAYGQTGSGKSYTMTGSKSDPGIIPLGCQELFNRVAENDDPNVKYEVAVSFMEIYNEKVRDLLNGDASNQKNLKVREIPTKGFFVQGLTKRDVGDYKSINKWMDIGNKQRTVASTKMNAVSSRSHSIFVIYFTKCVTTVFGNGEKSEGVTTSEVNLVDLAGSERTSKTGATGQTMKEANAINQSLTTLGNVIKALADLQKDQSEGKTVSKDFIPYRNSVLTKLLKSSLGGNAKTIMVAAISPAWDNWEETLSTLRYAWRAKSIKTRAIKNRVRSKAEIQAAFAELHRLKYMIEDNDQPEGDTEALAAEFEFIKEEWERLKLTLEERLSASEIHLKQITAAMSDSGISFHEIGTMLKISMDTPHFINMSHNTKDIGSPLLYFVLHKVTEIGGGNTSRAGTPSLVHHDLNQPGKIILNDSPSIREHHAVVEKEEDACYIKPAEPSEGQETPLVKVNGQVIMGRTKLEQNDRVLLGSDALWRYGQDQGALAASGAASGESVEKAGLRRALSLHDYQAEAEALKKENEELRAKLKSKACVLL